jgi:hypothetical protein
MSGVYRRPRGTFIFAIAFNCPFIRFCLSLMALLLQVKRSNPVAAAREIDCRTEEVPWRSWHLCTGLAFVRERDPNPVSTTAELLTACAASRAACLVSASEHAPQGFALTASQGSICLVLHGRGTL